MGMDDHRPRSHSKPGGQPPEPARLGRMGVDDVGAQAAYDPNQLDQGPQVGDRANPWSEARNDGDVTPSCLRKVCERRLAGTELAVDEQRRVAHRVHASAEQGHVVGGAADVHPRDDLHHAAGPWTGLRRGERRLRIVPQGPRLEQSGTSSSKNAGASPIPNIAVRDRGIRICHRWPLVNPA